MIIRNLNVTAAVLSVLALLISCKSDKSTSQKSAEGKVNEVIKLPLDSATKMQNMLSYGTPSEVHEFMATWDGRWDAEMKYWISGVPEPSIMTAESENKLINNGLISTSTHEGMLFDMPFLGVSQTGYDNHRNVMWNTWYDNLSSGLTYSEGLWNAETKTANLKGKMTDPETKQQVEFRQELKIPNDSIQTIEQFIMIEGKEVKVMEMVFRRIKD